MLSFHQSLNHVLVVLNRTIETNASSETLLTINAAKKATLQLFVEIKKKKEKESKGKKENKNGTADIAIIEIIYEVKGI